MSTPGSQISSALSGEAGRQQFKTTYEINPIILFGGIAGSDPNNSKLLSTFARGLNLSFIPIAGATGLSFQAATYPFANQAIAANAVIQDALRVSMLCICPASPGTASYLNKNSAFSGLLQSLTQHNNLGGTYSVTTPAYTYTNCLLQNVYDITDGESRQTQEKWRFDFYQPLLTLEQAQKVVSNTLRQIDLQLPQSAPPTWSGATAGNPYGLPVVAAGSLYAPSSMQLGYGRDGGILGLDLPGLARSLWWDDHD